MALELALRAVFRQEIEAQEVMRRLTGAAPVEPFAVPQLVAFPRLADGESREQRNQAGEERRVSVHTFLARSANDVFRCF